MKGPNAPWLTSFVCQPTNEELSAKVGDGMGIRRRIVGVFEASTSPLKERYTQSDTNVFQLSQPETFANPLSGVLGNGARALLARAVEAEVQGRMHRPSDREINWLPVTAPCDIPTGSAYVRLVGVDRSHGQAGARLGVRGPLSIDGQFNCTSRQKGRSFRRTSCGSKMASVVSRLKTKYDTEEAAKAVLRFAWQL
jgi:hypothetical protein